MYFNSTRNKKLMYTLTECIKLGLAEDGGLFIPEYFPKIDYNNFDINISYVEFSKNVLKEYFKNDPLNNYLHEICKNSFNFIIPFNEVNNGTFILDLFQGPTLSFKDFGARFLAQCFEHISTEKRFTIMVATSGDTGSAVASAFYKKNNIDVIILYPEGKISQKQEHQITCWDSNIYSFAVNGTFDDCQKMVKEAFQNDSWQNSKLLCTANSINIGRLLPQVIYYAYFSFKYFKKYDEMPGFIIPTGNMGNATAAYWAKEMGFPIREIVLSTNANNVILEYIETGEFSPRKSLLTLANAMDVGNPSNFERLKILFDDHLLFKNNISAYSITDAQIRETIADVFKNDQKLICPHTATAFCTRKLLNSLPWIVVATAHPCKFDEVIESIIPIKNEYPKQLLEMLYKKCRHIKVEAKIEKLAEKFNNFQNNNKFTIYL
ncbi:threonine synthase [Silvanigrella aquatica]|uniref:Threonine synthase n=1 Tax=Silvanigrella aquatica TaxID=1915309 RepID=A0A1L4D0I4_9BACT|nr:threonine synthase [Silvanigrella aquatica]APJ03704.1 threonine synthase [Silvanigrella aquatica]